MIPIEGFHLPAPPDWRRTNEADHFRRLAAGVLSPDDLTLDGRPRCTHVSEETGKRCGNAVERGTTVCRYHGASNAHHPDFNGGTQEGPGSAGRAQRIERVRMALEYGAMSAAIAVTSILESEDARPQDRLKAAEILLDRTVGRTIQLEKEDASERDLDQEILQIAADLGATGTEGK